MWEFIVNDFLKKFYLIFCIDENFKSKLNQKRISQLIARNAIPFLRRKHSPSLEH